MNDRRRQCRCVAMFGLVFALSLPASAVTVAGVAFPDQFATNRETLTLNGAGVRVFFGFVRGYASALYVRSPSRSIDAILDQPNPKVIRTAYLHAAGLGQLRQEFANVHDHYCARNICPPANEASYHQMVATLMPVNRGDTSTFIVTDTGVEVMRDDKSVLTIANPAYGRAFLAAAIGPTSPTPGYRAGLLGQPD